MDALDLDFRRDHAKPGWIGALLLAAALGVGLMLWKDYQQVLGQTAAAESNLRAIGMATRKKAAPERPAADAQKTQLELKRANEVLARLKLPWNDLFVSVESAKLPDVALLAIESDTEKRRVKISAEAKDPLAMLEYLRFLQSQPALSEIYLQNHQYQQQDPQRPVRFTLSADWTVRP